MEFLFKIIIAIVIIRFLAEKFLSARKGRETSADKKTKKKRSWLDEIVDTLKEEFDVEDAFPSPKKPPEPQKTEETFEKEFHERPFIEEFSAKNSKKEPKSPSSESRERPKIFSSEQTGPAQSAKSSLDFIDRHYTIEQKMIIYQALMQKASDR